MADVEARGLAAVAFVRVEAPQVEIAMAAAAQKEQAGRDPAEVDPANLAEVEEGVEVMEDAEHRQEQHHLQDHGCRNDRTFHPHLAFQANLFINKPVDVFGAHNLRGTVRIPRWFIGLRQLSELALQVFCISEGSSVCVCPRVVARCHELPVVCPNWEN